jgi:predicted O-linked N-acetylglucosamine transferase (SPINDLY family)
VVQNLPGRADILECLKLADIYLDSFPYTGAASLIDPLIIGVPTVVREGESARAKRGSAILRELQLPELITESENSYIDLSVALGTHPDLRQHYRQKIEQQMAQNPRFLDSDTYSTQMGILLRKIYNGDIG